MADIKLPPGAKLVDDSAMKLPPGASLVTDQTPPPVPGTEKTGLPAAGLRPSPPADMGPNGLGDENSEGGGMNEPGLPAIVNQGLHQLGRSVPSLFHSKPNGSLDPKAGLPESGSNLLQGTAKVASPLMLPAAISAPGPTLLGAAGSYLGNNGGQMLAKKMGFGPQGRQFAGDMGGLAGGVAGAGGGAKIADLMPSVDRAGRNFQAVDAAAKNTPVDLTRASVPALRAQELGNVGPSPPPVLSKFLDRTTAPNSKPMLFPESRDFQSSAGRLSANDKMSLTPQMGSQVAQLAKALSEANEEAAVKAGVGDQYRSAMTEYRRAMQFGEAKDKAGQIAMDIAKKALIYGPPVAFGAYGAKKVLDGVTK